MPCLLCVACGVFVWLGLGLLGCNSGLVHVCALTLHSHKCSFEICKSCDSSSRMSWLDVGRLWGLLQCERASSDNLSSSLSDDSLRVLQLRDVMWKRSVRGLSKPVRAAMMRGYRSLSSIYFSFFFFCQVRQLKSTGGMVKATADSLHWECGLWGCVC